jgi:hypothetical protein
MDNLNTVISTLVSGALIFLVILTIIFLIFREFFCWYWKINSNAALLTEIRDLLAAKGNSQGGVVPVVKQSSQTIEPAAPVPPPKSTEKLCPECGAMVDDGSAFCAQCGAKL